MFEKNNQNQKSEQHNDQEKIPVIIQKKRQDYADYSNRYYYFSPEENYPQISRDGEKQVYRWNAEEEEHKSQAKNKIKKAVKNRGLKIFAGAMAVMFAFSAVLTTVLLVDHLNGSPLLNSGRDFEPLTLSVPPIGSHSEELALFGSVSEVIAKVRPSVVSIQAEIEIIRGSFWGRGDSFTQTGVGTGFVLTENGYIATNYHVIENAATITVQLKNGRRYNATVIGGDAVADIAIIKITARNLVPAELGNSDAMREGDFVIAIGSPGGLEFAGSSTFGIVSGTDRDVRVSRGRNMTLLQHDAAINPGNSGGPLVNMSGQVIGINTLKLASSLGFMASSINYEGMGFAIPITLAVETFNDIIANPGEIIRLPQTPQVRQYDERDTSGVSFGISGRTVTAAEAEAYDVPRGFSVLDVSPGGASDRAGIKFQDIIIALDGETVESFEELIELKHNYQPGDEAVVTVYRDGEILELTIAFDARETN